MKKYVHFINNNKKILIIIFMIVNIIALVGVTKIRFNTDFSVFSTKESVYQDRLDELEETFGDLNQIIVLVEHPNFNDETIQDLRYIQANIELMENIDYVQGVAPKELVINNAVVQIEDISSSQLLTYYDSFGKFSPLIVEEDTYYSTFTVFISNDFGNKDINKIENILDTFDYSTFISGDSYNQLKISDYIFKILLMLPPLAIIVILLVFKWQMGAFKPTLMSILPAAMGSLWTFGFIGWLGNEVTLLTAIVPILIIVIGSADGLHFMSHFQDAKNDGKDNIIGLTNTLNLVGIPMIVTTLTSIAGFLSLLTIQTESVFDLAIFSSIGILFAGIATWYVLPLLLVGNIDILPNKSHKKKIDLSSYLRKLWGIPSFIIVLIVLIITVFSFSHIDNEFNMLMIYKKSTIVNKNAEKIQEVNGGSIPIFVTIKLDSTPISLTSLDEVNDLADELNNFDKVSKVINPYEFMNLIYKTNFDDDIPNDIVLNNIYSGIISNKNNIIDNLISVDETTVRLLVFTNDLDNDTLTEIEEVVTSFSDNASVTGVQYLMKDLNVNIASMQIRSILLALGIVLLMLLVTLRSFKIAIYSLLPIVVTVIGLYGFLGLSGISLNVTTVIIFSITIGVGIDYAIHFSSLYKYYLKENNDNDSAIEKAYNNSSKPIITNALGISLGLSILMLSPLNIHFNVSVLMWVSMGISVLVTLTLLPTIFRLRNK